MSKRDKAQFQSFGAAAVGFLAVVAVGALLLLLPRGAGMKAPETAYAPVDASSRAFARPRTVRPVPPEARASSPAPLLPESDGADEAAAAPAPSPAPAAQASAAPAAATPPALAADAPVDMTGSARSSARLDAKAVAAVPAAAKAKIPALKPFAQPKLDLSRSSAFAATVHYSVASRAELMGRAAGPVYNFGGADLKAKLGAVAGQTSHQVEAAQAQLDTSAVSPQDKSAFDKNAAALQASIQSATAAAGK